jgi:hypothetical protein
MVRRRTATLSLTAAALLLATPLITSCGAQHPGAAAIVGGRSISVADLQTQVKQVRAAQDKTGQGATLIDATGNLDQTTLSNMVIDRVLDRAAHNAGVTVSRSDVQKVEASFIAQAGSVATLKDVLLRQDAVAPAQLDDFLHAQAEAQAIAVALGADLSTQQGKDALDAALGNASRQLHIDVNPRFGTWNAKTLSLTTAPQPWLHTATTPAPSLPQA